MEDAPEPERTAGQRAVDAALRGDAAAARHWAAEADVAAAEAGSDGDHLRAWWAYGLAALVEADAPAAVAALGHVWQQTAPDGDVEAVPVAHELVAALVTSGRLEEANRVVAALEDHASPWAELGARRGRALLALAVDDFAGAPRELRVVADRYVGLGLRFDAARTLLVLGRSMRERRRWTAARTALTTAATMFDDLGCDGWAAAAGADLDGVAGSRPRSAPDDLTPAERRVVALAAEGRANREIAQALKVTINTVETHLTRAYAKLGVRGRAQLAGRLGERTSRSSRTTS